MAKKKQNQENNFETDIDFYKAKIDEYIEYLDKYESDEEFAEIIDLIYFDIVETTSPKKMVFEFEKSKLEFEHINDLFIKTEDYEYCSKIQRILTHEIKEVEILIRIIKNESDKRKNR